MLHNISFITAHFRDFEWTKLLVESIRQSTPPESINEIIIIDQDRCEESRTYLQNLDIKIRAVQYPKSEPHFLIAKHDHAAVLNAAIREAKGDWLIIFDSDAHPMSDSYLKRVEEKLRDYDAILAEDPGCPGLTHPCFMVLKKEHVELNLAFDKEMLESSSHENEKFNKYVDTGRLIGKQLQEANERVYICPAKHAFNGHHGTTYLDTVYHHGHGSYKKNESDVLQKQVSWQNGYFRSYVMKHKLYNLTFFGYAKFRILRYLNSLPSRFQRSKAY